MKRCTLQMSLVLGLLAGCQALEQLENRCVYHPAPAAGKPGLPPPPWEDMELRTADGVKIHARWCPHPDAKGVLIYCHGNAGNLERFNKLASDLWITLDRSILLFDYPGFGRSEGKPSEKGCYAAADAAYDAVMRMNGASSDHVVICGESLGGGVAVDLASRRPHQTLVLIRTFTSIPDVAKQQFSVISAPAIMVNRFESLKKIPTCRMPIFLAQADQDRLIPFAHGEKLRDACQAPVRFHRLRGLDHNDPLPADFFVALRAFLDEPTAR